MTDRRGWSVGWRIKHNVTPIYRSLWPSAGQMMIEKCSKETKRTRWRWREIKGSHKKGVNFPPPTQAHFCGLPPPRGVPKINKSVPLTPFTSPPDLSSSHLFHSSLENVLPSTPLCYFLSPRPSRCLAQWQQQQQQQWERGPGATRWGSPARIGMLTLYPSPSVETDLFDLRCDCVFSSPHLPLPLNHAPTHSPTHSSLDPRDQLL